MNTDVIVFSLSSDGSSLRWSTYIGPIDPYNTDTQDIGNGIYIDGKDRIHITGVTESEYFPTSPNGNDRIFG